MSELGAAPEYRRCNVRGWSAHACAPVRCVKEAGHERDWGNALHHSYASAVSWDQPEPLRWRSIAELWEEWRRAPLDAREPPLLPERTESWDRLQREVAGGDSVILRLLDRIRDLEQIVLEVENENAQLETDLAAEEERW